jgi:hypothetical protein
MNKPQYRSGSIRVRPGPSLTGIAVYISTVVAGTAVIVLPIRGLTDSWAAGGIVAIATGLSVGGYAWVTRAHDNDPRGETVQAP